MKLSFNQTLRQSSLENDLQLCEKHGYDAIELRLSFIKDYLQDHSIDELATYFQRHHIKPLALNSLEFVTFCNEKDYSQIREDLAFLCEVGNKIGCDTIVVVPSFNIGDYTMEEIKKESVRVLNDLADYAEQENMRLAFEFVGHPDCCVNTFDQCEDIINEVNRESVGMVLDIFHFHSLGSNIEDLRNFDPNKIFVIHIDDADDFPRGYLKENIHRLFPGDGAINLDLILSTLKEIGYNGAVSVELFRDEYYTWDPEKFIRVSREKTAEVVGKHFTVATQA
ncbi:sugar phosphate isomerase/epimerase family protein [Metabacillus litoralis]|jgi:2-keto-myo-inositol isomerase|uniref:sugar phosphate isomerase/epimerase family protein n=1 Tax=Metabacillus litoralis TaxID=152268 RepID=UPI00203C9C84|nr:sugar phosphate isomerase/epimerase [Metabacillus litoralis]MCM3652285.1 sugar phosphate isomerase/epimerase [Metabacillus litoralis]